MKIDSLDTNADKLLSGTKFSIPRFQRPYSWERNEVKDFLEDIFTDEGDEYFIGSMVMYTHGERNAIVDGQQRMSTIVIVLCAIRNHFIEQGLDNLAEGVQSYIEKINKEAEFEFTLNPETSYPYFQNNIMAMAKGDPNDVPDNEEELKVHKAYKLAFKYFQDSIKSINQDPTIKKEDKNKHIQNALTDFRDKLLSVKIVTITLDNEHDAYIVFETLNTRGRDLSITDLIKNHVTRRWAKENNDLDNATDIWNEIIETFDQSSSEIKSDDFFHHQWSSKHTYTSKKSLFSKFTIEITEDKVEEYLRQTNFDAKIYRLIREPSYQNSDVSVEKQDEDILKSLEALRLFKVTMPNPALLSALRGYFSGNIKPKQAKSILETIEKYHFVNSAITSQRSSGSTQKLYSTWGIELFQAGDDASKIGEIIAAYKESLVSDLAPKDEFLEYFDRVRYTGTATKDKKLVQYILGKFHQHFGNGQPINYSQMTIEHVVPQSLAEKELNQPGLVGHIGNLIFINNDLNGELGDKNFSEKKEIFSKCGDQGVQNDLLCSYNKFQDDEILDRANKLADLAYDTIWKI